MRKQIADMLLVNGRFLTMEQPGEMAEAVAIANGRILFVGAEAQAREYAGEGTRILDLEGKVENTGTQTIKFEGVLEEWSE